MRMAGDVARRFDSTVDLLHVKSPEASGAESEDALSERLDQLAQQMVEEGVRSVRSVVVAGEEFDQIERYARHRDVNVIMVGAGEAGSSGQVFLGTTAARLRRAAVEPVWIVKPNAAPPVQRICCPVDMLPASARALRNAIHFARTLDAALTVLTVTQLPLGEQGDQHELRGPAAVGPPEFQEPHFPEFDEFLRKFDFHQVCCEKLIRRGKPREEVVAVAREMQADLIVMGSTGRTGLSHMFIGGVARRVAQELPCSVITVRSQEPIGLPRDTEAPRLDVEFCASHPSGKQCERFQYGEELLARGLAQEAIEHFRACVAEYDRCANAWLQLSEAHLRFGDYEKARRCAGKAEEALRWQEKHQIEKELRDSHILHRRLFDI